MSEQAIKAFQQLQEKGLLTAEQDYAPFLAGFKAARDALGAQLREAENLADQWAEKNAALCKEAEALRAENARLTTQLAAIQGGMGEVVGFDRNAAYSACPESGCDWGSFYVGWRAAAAQHQRITAAMAAEVERLSRMLNNATNDGIKLADERDALATELAIARRVIDRIGQLCTTQHESRERFIRRVQSVIEWEAQAISAKASP